MTSPLAKKISRIYLGLAVLGAILLSPLPYSFIALVLLLIQAYSAYKPLRADLSLVLAFCTLLFVPQALESSAIGPLSALLVIPALPLLDDSLKRNTLNRAFSHAKGRKPTTTLKALSAALLAVLVISLLTASWALTIAAILLAAYLAAVSGYTVCAIRGAPLQSSTGRVRVVAGSTAEASVAIRSTSRLLLHAQLTSPHRWISINPGQLSIERNEQPLNLSVTPPLSGPSVPQLQAVVIDPWGLIQFTQYIEPIELYVIPRTRYAEWLAREFLGRAALQTPSAATAPAVATARISRRGVEYLASHIYQPGDTLRDVDWKRTCKLGQIVVKEYGEPGNPATIVAANLVANDPEEADRLAYDLITSVLTLAKVAAPAALAAYDHQRVLLTTGASNPRETLDRALKVARNMTTVEQEHRFLRPPDVRRLKRSMAQLGQAQSETAQRLAALLRLEEAAIQQSAEDHPAARALAEVTQHVPPPATISVVSAHNHDAEALAVTLDRLAEQGYRVLPAQPRAATKTATTG
jgi:uncharacterized protein (DUF58 family)